MNKHILIHMNTLCWGVQNIICCSVGFSWRKFCDGFLQAEEKVELLVSIICGSRDGGGDTEWRCGTWNRLHAAGNARARLSACLRSFQCRISSVRDCRRRQFNRSRHLKYSNALVNHTSLVLAFHSIFKKKKKKLIYLNKLSLQVQSRVQWKLLKWLS